MDLGEEANFLFTSEMTNCRFSILTTESNPKIAHVAGNVSSSKRNQLEKGAGFPSKEEDVDRKVRRMSISQASDHGYKGQRSEYDDSSSAFVFGHRTDGWKFYAQIAKGNLSGDFIDKLTDNIEIIHAHYEI